MAELTPEQAIVRLWELSEYPTEFHLELSEAARVLEKRIGELEAALQKVNAIRNSIIGCQTANWSEHVYPLVAALNEAGFEGQAYESARENVGTMLDRTIAAEKRVEELETALELVRVMGFAELVPVGTVAVDLGLARCSDEVAAELMCWANAQDGEVYPAHVTLLLKPGGG